MSVMHEALYNFGNNAIYLRHNIVIFKKWSRQL